jgi:hypothetical protein
MAAQALTAPNALGPDRLTTPATGGRIRVAADSTAVAPIDEPMSTNPVGAAAAELRGRRDVPVDPRARPGTWLGVAEPL